MFGMFVSVSGREGEFNRSSHYPIPCEVLCMLSKKDHGHGEARF